MKLDMLTRLKKRQSQNNNIKIALLGAGSMGKGIFYQSSITPGIDCLAISDIHIDRAIESVKNTGQEYCIVDNQNELLDCINKNIIAVCEDGMLLAECELFDAFLDASNSIKSAAIIDLKALENKMHLIMVNAEADLLYGPHFLKIAMENNVIYTSSDGDQPGVIQRIVDEMNLWGFKLVMAGNIKGFLDRYSNPTKIIPEADKRNLDYKMCTSYTDGTKVAVEMALVANALNCSVLTPGMKGKSMNSVHDIFSHYDFESLYNDNKTVVEFILGATPKGGVFAVGYCNDIFQQSMLDWFPPNMGEGRFNLFYRPYHLCHVETMRTIAEAVLDYRPLMTPKYGLLTNVYAYAKQNIKNGEKLDGIGGYSCYGLIENIETNKFDEGLPICLANDVVIKRDIGKDKKIGMSDVQFDPNRIDFKLYNKVKTISK